MDKLDKAHIVLLDIDRVIDARGGPEKVFCNMANALVKRGYRVTALCCEPKKGKPAFNLSPEVHFINAYDQAQISWKYNKPWNKFWNFSWNKHKRFVNRITCKFKKISPCIESVLQQIPQVDIFITSQPESTFILKECLNQTVPIVTMFHFAPEKYTNHRDFVVFKNSLEHSTSVQVLMPEYEAQIKSCLPNLPVFCIPNVVPEFSQSACENKLIINIARLNFQKRPELFVEAYSRIYKDFMTWKCEWWGENNLDAEYLNMIKSLIQDKGLQDVITLRGTTDNVEEVLKRASIFAFPSEYEGFPLALTEAMSAGLPVVGTKDCCSVNTLIRDGVNGFLTEPTPEAFAQALSQLMENQELRIKLGKQAKEDMKAYSAEVVWDMWDDLIQKVIKEHQSK